MMILTRSFLDRPDSGILCPSPSLDKTQLSQMSCGGLDWIGFTIGYSVVVKTCRKESKICRKGYKICRKESKICTKESDCHFLLYKFYFLFYKSYILFYIFYFLFYKFLLQHYTR